MNTSINVAKDGTMWLNSTTKLEGDIAYLPNAKYQEMVENGNYKFYLAGNYMNFMPVDKKAIKSLEQQHRIVSLSNTRFGYGASPSQIQNSVAFLAIDSKGNHYIAPKVPVYDYEPKLKIIHVLNDELMLTEVQPEDLLMVTTGEIIEVSLNGIKLHLPENPSDMDVYRKAMKLINN